MTTKMMTLASAIALGTTVFAAEDTLPSTWTYVPGKGVSFNEQPIVSAEFGLAFDSKYMTYGVVDGKDPIVTPSASATLFDWVYFGISAIYDVSKGNGKRGEYGNRAGKYTLLDASVGIAHDIELCESLGKLRVDFNYMYEYAHRYWSEDDEKDVVDDTQYLNLTLSLNDLWFEPKLWIERDLMADDGTYVNFEIGHTFTLVGDEESQTLTFRPSAGQGIGNTLRAKGYFYKHPCLGDDPDDSDKLNHGGLMDTSVKAAIEWQINDWLKFGGYVAYYDYVFDHKMRDGARWHNAVKRGRSESSAASWNVVCGLSLTATF